MQLADNRVRIEKLMEDIENGSDMEETDDLKNEIDYINTSIQLGLLEITGELEDIQSSEEIFEEATT
jgi:predicted  nucleic acid-binding Zn-ribbon protein